MIIENNNYVIVGYTSKLYGPDLQIYNNYEYIKCTQNNIVDVVYAYAQIKKIKLQKSVFNDTLLKNKQISYTNMNIEEQCIDIEYTEKSGNSLSKEKENINPNVIFCLHVYTFPENPEVKHVFCNNKKNPGYIISEHYLYTTGKTIKFLVHSHGNNKNKMISFDLNVGEFKKIMNQIDYCIEWHYPNTPKINLNNKPYNFSVEQFKKMVLSLTKK